MLKARASLVRAVPLTQLFTRAFSVSAAVRSDRGGYSSPNRPRGPQSGPRSGPYLAEHGKRSSASNSEKQHSGSISGSRSASNPRASHSNSSYGLSRQTTSKRLTQDLEGKARGGLPPHLERQRAQQSQRVPAYRQKENVELSKPRDFGAYPLLNPGLVSALQDKFPGGKTTPIQSLSLGRLLDLSAQGGVEAQGQSGKGRQGKGGPTGIRAILGAETGSGKTLAYLLPLLHHLKATDMGPTARYDTDSVAPRALVLAPTHELTRQSTAVAKSLTHTAKLSVMGASSPGSVKGAGDVDVLFATGRSAAQLLGIPREDDLHDTRERDRDEQDRRRRREDAEPLLDLSRVEWLVIDESDVLLGPGFLDETAKVLDKLRRSPGARGGASLNILLVTATLPPSLLRAVESNPLLSSGSVPSSSAIKLQSPTSPERNGFTQLLSPGLHRLPRHLETRFVPWSKSGNPLADVAHEIKRGFAEDAFEAKLGAEGESKGPKDKSMAVVFCSSVNKVNMAVQTLEAKGIPCLAWAGDSEARKAGHNGPLDAFLVKHKREREVSTPRDEALREEYQLKNQKDSAAAKDTKDGKEKDKTQPRVLVTTSLLSRGLDFSPLVSTIYLLDPPRTVLDFVHRAGRAGRAGRPGRVVVFGMSHAGQSKYAEELKGVLGKSEMRRAVKPGGRQWGKRDGGREREERGRR